MLIGVVLCGGKSTRMGTDKAFLSYYNKPQYQQVALMLKPLCHQVIISCNANQLPLISTNYNTILDEKEWFNSGPVGGILSVFKHNPNAALLVVGCDYPLLQTDDLQALIANRNPATDVVCFYNQKSGYLEPILAIYEPTCYQQLLNNFSNNQTSLQQFIKSVKHKTVLCIDETRITSIDTQEKANALNL